MIYPYRVKHNGIYYNPGENVPIEVKVERTAPSEPLIKEIKPETISKEVVTKEEKPKSKGGRPRKTEG